MDLYEERIRRTYPAPILLTPWTYESPGLVASGVAYQGSFLLEQVFGMNTAGGVRFLHIFNSGRPPIAGAIPDVVRLLAAGSNFSYSPVEEGLAFSSGLSFGLSASPAVFVSAGALLSLTVSGYAL